MISILELKPTFILRNLRSAVVVLVATALVLISLQNLRLWAHNSKFTFKDGISTLKECSADTLKDADTPSAFRCRILLAQERALSIRRRQSSSPEEAVFEYKRRYQRNPPKGFEDWVSFALHHNSKIIDDFDQIDRYLEPYRTSEAQQTFRTLSEQTTGYPSVSRIQIRNGTMSMSSDYMYGPELEKLIEPFVQQLPDSVFYLNTLDEPRVLGSSGQQSAAIQFHERPGESIEDLILGSCSQLNPKLDKWRSEYKDVCQYSHPADLHRLIASPDSFSYTYSLVPMLSFGRMSAFRDIIIPCPCYAKHPLVEDTVPFLEKKPMLYWRGSSTGGRASRFTWRSGHRERFVSFVQSLQQTATILDTSRYFGSKLDNLNSKQISLLKDVFDVHIGAYIQCDEESCKDMERILGHPDMEPEDTSADYRFLYDIDGNSMSTRFYRLLSRQAVVLKQTWFQEWHDDRLIPWAHYIPITMTMDELPALLDFLINDPIGESLSADIANAGSTWSREVLREIDLSIYLYRLLLELAELYNFNI